MRRAVVLVLIIAGAFIAANFLFTPQERFPSTKVSPGNFDIKKWESKTDDQASITVTVSPIDLSPQSEEWKFSITMDTHSIELNQDLTKIAALFDEQGREFKPISWEGSPERGHHREGTLIFKAIKPRPRSIELKLFDIGEIIRNFSWQI